jgi:hypothetical protein
MKGPARRGVQALRQPAGRPLAPAEPSARPRARRYTEAISRTGHLRASDADRDEIAERLRTAATEGRIGFDELEERLATTLGARTYADLEAVVADLPPSTPARRRSVLPASPVARVAIAVALAIPVLMAALVALTAVLSAWILWVLAGWCLFGDRYGYRRYPYGRHRHPYGGPRHAQRRAQAGPSRGFWA